jgi:D-alanyl-D-alanine carboxypeptidase
VAAVASGPGFRWEGAAGIANIETGEPLTPEHRFHVGSVTKLFIAAAVLQLVHEGALALDGDASPLVPGVTIRQLLNHTSGLPDPFEDLVAVFEPYRRHQWDVGPHELLAGALQRPRLFPPGKGWAYGSTNYLVLGLLVEETTGATLRQELKRRIIEPLELGATDLPADIRDSAGLARGYLPPDNPLIPGPALVDATELDFPFSWAGGGIASTARDVARFLQALLGGELLPPRLRAEMLTTVPSGWEESDAYGLGIEQVTCLMGKSESPCGGAWGHLGFSPGYTTIALASEDGARQVVVMANGLETSGDLWEPLGALVWAAYCSP